MLLLKMCSLKYRESRSEFSKPILTKNKQIVSGVKWIESDSI